MVLDECGFRAYCGDVDWGSNLLSYDMLLREFYSIKQEGAEERRAKDFAILESRHPEKI